MINHLFWIALAGLCEIWWAIGLKRANGFIEPVSADIYAAMVLSIIFLDFGMKGLPVGTVYAIWTGIGAIGTTAVSISVFAEPGTPMRLASLGLIIVGIIGLGCADWKS